MARRAMRNIAVPAMPAKRFQLGYHRIPIASDEATCPHFPDEADRVQPLDPLGAKRLYFALPTSIENPYG